MKFYIIAKSALGKFGLGQVNDQVSCKQEGQINVCASKMGGQVRLGQFYERTQYKGDLNARKPT